MTVYRLVGEFYLDDRKFCYKNPSTGPRTELFELTQCQVETLMAKGDILLQEIEGAEWTDPCMRDKVEHQDDEGRLGML